MNRFAEGEDLGQFDEPFGVILAGVFARSGRRKRHVSYTERAAADGSLFPGGSGVTQTDQDTKQPDEKQETPPAEESTDASTEVAQES